jgi:L-ascorbate metabolism protein UlaG (beta-lactamase superfamily)
MDIKYLGHSSFLISTDKGSLLFDPFISANEKASDIDIDALKPNFILLSHGHQDHVLDAERIAKNSGSTIISNFEIATWYGNKGLENIGLNHGGSVNIPFASVKYVNAIHSSVLPDGTYGGNPGGFIVEIDNKTFYYAGDTAVFSDMALFSKLHKIDFAFLPIGGHFTMDDKEVLLASQLLDCKNIIGMHFDTFPPIEINHKETLQLFDKNGVSLHLPKIGETFTR